MNRTLVAVFDSREQAEACRHDLLDAGFTDQAVMISESQKETKTARAGSQDKGFWEQVREFFGMEDQGLYDEASRRGQIILAAEVDDAQSEVALEIFDRHNPVDIDRRAEEWRAAGWTGPVGTQGRAEGTRPAEDLAAPGRGAERVERAGQEKKIPVTEERMRVGKRVEQRGGVRVFTRVTEKPVEENVRLREERVRVERQPADRPAGEEAFNERSIEVHETREEAVVSKEARVVEDVVVSKDVEERDETIRGTVRRTDVEVEQLENVFRRDYETAYGRSGMSYEEYRPAYEFGSRIAQDESYHGRNWGEIESQARQSFERDHPGTWDRFHDAVRSAYERTRSMGREAA